MLPDRIAFFPHAFRHFLRRSERFRHFLRRSGRFRHFLQRSERDGHLRRVPLHVHDAAHRQQRRKPNLRCQKAKTHYVLSVVHHGHAERADERVLAVHQLAVLTRVKENASSYLHMMDRSLTTTKSNRVSWLSSSVLEK